MKSEEEKAAHRKYDHYEEEVNHDYICYFVRKVSAKEIPALCEEIEGKLLHVSFINDEQENPIERVFPNVFRNTIVKEYFEDAGHKEVGCKCKRQLEEEEIEVI